jgi:hypothetical protein
LPKGTLTPTASAAPSMATNSSSGTISTSGCRLLIPTANSAAKITYQISSMNSVHEPPM